MRPLQIFGGDPKNRPPQNCENDPKVGFFLPFFNILLVAKLSFFWRIAHCQKLPFFEQILDPHAERHFWSNYFIKNPKSRPPKKKGSPLGFSTTDPKIDWGLIWVYPELADKQRLYLRTPVQPTDFDSDWGGGVVKQKARVGDPSQRKLIINANRHFWLLLALWIISSIWPNLATLVDNFSQLTGSVWHLKQHCTMSNHFQKFAPNSAVFQRLSAFLSRNFWHFQPFPRGCYHFDHFCFLQKKRINTIMPKHMAVWNLHRIQKGRIWLGGRGRWTSRSLD